MVASGGRRRREGEVEQDGPALKEVRGACGPMAWLVAVLLHVCAGSGCGPGAAPGEQPGGGDLPVAGYDGEAMMLAVARPQVATGPESQGAATHLMASVPTSARPSLCDRPRHDAVRDVFCAETPPVIRALAELQEALGLSLEEPGPRVHVAALGHSTALSGHRVSPINPRLIVMAPPLFMAYQRGVQKVEIIASAGGGQLNFYLFRFEQACNQRPQGCLPGDLYTPQVERQWVSWRLEDGEDLKNTPDDCRQCHQRGRAQPALLMRELSSPWTHFLQPVYPQLPDDSRPGVRGADLMRDYVAAKADEPYGGFYFSALSPIAPFVLESIVGVDQPLLFDAPKIDNERWPLDPDTGYPKQPQPSPSWEAAYEAFKRGEQLALPYVEPRAVDVDKQAALSAAYVGHQAGSARAPGLPELSDIFPDDPLVRARIGLQTEPGSDAVEVMIQACGPCHNDVLDQSISRARFNIDLWGLRPDALAVAIERIERGPMEPGVMPPPEARQLDAEGRRRLLDYLRQDPLSGEPDTRLLRAAERGMAGVDPAAASVVMGDR